MARRLGIFRRIPDSGGGKEPERSEPGTEVQASPERSRESTPATHEWQIGDGAEPAAGTPRTEPAAPIQGRVAAADAADAAEQRSIEELLALEQDVERVKVEVAAKLEELEGRLAEMEDRASTAGRQAQDAQAKVADAIYRSRKPSGSWTSATGLADSTRWMTSTTCRGSRSPSSPS